MKRNLKRILSIVLCAVMVFAFVPNASETTLAATKGQLQSQISSINSQQKEIQKKLDALEADASKHEEYQAQLSAQMDLSQQKIDTLQAKIDIINEQIDVSLTQIAEKEESIANSTELFKKRLRTMYMSSNASTLSIILGSSDFYEMMTSLDMVKRVTEYDKGLVTEMVEEIKLLEEEKKLLDERKAELDVSREEIASEVAVLAAAYDKSELSLKKNTINLLQAE